MFYKDQQIGQYILIERLGVGGFGEVWLARSHDTSSSPHVAIKLPKREDINWQAIVQEIGLWVLCGKHPNVVPFIEARNYNGQIAIISEYAPDGSLRDLLKKEGSLPLTQAVEMIIGVLDGLAHLHSNGIIHRDLKPENILLEGNMPRLADFGVSRVITINSYSQTVSGTLWYMAPEAFNGKRNAQTDIWSIGVILYELLKGSLPFPQKEQTALIGAIVMNNPEPLPGSIPSELQEIVHKALAKQAGDRYRTAAEMHQTLHDYWQSLYGQEMISTIEHTIPASALETSSIEQTIQVNKPGSIIEPNVISETEKIIQVNELEGAVKSLQLIPYRKGDKWGFCDLDKNIIIPLKYEYASLFSEDLAHVKLNDKWGYIDKSGREVIPLKYEGATPYSEDLASVQMNSKWGYIDKTGRIIIPPKYAYPGYFSEGLAVVKLDSKYGYIDKTGREIIPIKYELIFHFNEGLVPAQLNGKWSYLDKAGRVAIPMEYDNAYSFYEGLARIELNGKWGYIDKSGRIIIPPRYSYPGPFSEGSFREGLARVVLNYSKYGYIDKTGREIIPIKYDEALSFSEGLASVRLNGRGSYIDKTGQEVIQIKYDKSYSFKEGLASVKMNGKWGYIDKTGREVTAIKYDDAFPFDKGLARVKLNGKEGYFGRDATEYFEG